MMNKRVLGTVLPLQAICAVALTVAGAQDIHSPEYRSSMWNILSQVSDTSLGGYILGLQNFGTRHWANANRDSVARWMRATFSSVGIADVAIDSFQYSGTMQYNVVATIPGSVHSSKEIIFGAHTDATTSNPAVSPGADDNASGSAAILEIARVLRNVGYQPARTFRFIGFAAEEAGLRGSAAYAAKAQARGDQIEAMINFDMIGYRPRSTTERRFHVVKYANGADLASLDSLMAVTYTSLTPFVTTANASRSDSYSFSTRGYAAVFLFDGGTSTSFHTVNDLLDSLDMGYAAEVVRTGLAAALTLDGQIIAVAESTPTGIPSEYRLDQNYPNPFNPSTAISFSVARTTPLSLRVYDLMGRAVALLAEGQHGPGTYTARWDAAGFPAGVYFCQLSVEGGTLTRRMILLR